MPARMGGACSGVIVNIVKGGLRACSTPYAPIAALFHLMNLRRAQP